MNIFDRFLHRAIARSSGPPSEGQVIVPEGHKVTAYQPQPQPYVTRSAGGVCIADQGSSSDEPVAELERLFREVEDVIRGNRSRVLMATGAGQLSELFAPGDPAVRPLAGALLWVLNPAAFVESSLGVPLLQMLLRKLHIVATRSTPPLTQFAFVTEFASAGACLMAALLSQIGLQVRECDPKLGSVLLEVHRPEGFILSALPGRVLAPNQTADVYVRQINEEKDHAEEQGDIARLRKLQQQEQEELTRRLTPVQEKRVMPVTRAAHLCRLLLKAHEGGAEAWEALCTELLRREIPLLVFVDPKTHAAQHRIWPDKGEAMPAYPDRASLMRAVSDLGMPMESFAAAEMPPRDLFCWMGKQQSAVAINVIRDDKTPLYVWLQARAVQALAEGKVPQRPSEMCQ